MARSQLTVTDIARSGVTPIAQLISDAVNKHYFTGNSGQEFVEIENVSGGSITVTFQAGPSIQADGLVIEDYKVGVLPGTVIAGPFRRGTFDQNSNGDVYFNADTSTTVRFRAYRLTRTA
jgi:hypothetical protein